MHLQSPAALHGSGKQSEQHGLKTQCIVAPCPICRACLNNVAVTAKVDGKAIGGDYKFEKNAETDTVRLRIPLGKLLVEPQNCVLDLCVFFRGCMQALDKGLRDSTEQYAPCWPVFNTSSVSSTAAITPSTPQQKVRGGWAFMCGWEMCGSFSQHRV